MRLALGALLLAFVHAPLAGQELPKGYHWGASASLPDSLYESIAHGRAGLTISRRTRDTVERRMLAIAERVYPDSGAFGDSLWGGMNTPYLQELYRKASARPGANRWWSGSAGNMLWPFAVTGQAIAYYLEYARALADTPPSEHRRVPLGSPPAIRLDPPQFAMRYFTSVAPVVETGGYVVTLNLRLSRFDVGNYYSTSRTVQIARDGTVTKISGDGVPRLQVE